MTMLRILCGVLAGTILLIASLAEAASIRLDWQDNAGNEANFQIERKVEACSGPAPFVSYATTGANIVTFTDTAVSEGNSYCYRVAASNPGGTSAFSNTSEKTIPFTIPAVPSGLTTTVLP